MKPERPAKLYGRDREISSLVDSLEHVGRGHGQIVLVPGVSGVGKTALATELEVPTRSRNGIFIRGKFDQYNRNLPYAAFRQALGELCRRLLRADRHERQQFRGDILEAVGGRGQLLVDLVPEFVLLLGQQPPLAAISPQEARHRFAQVLRDFLTAICRPEHPLVLFIDDWQWADAASLELLKQLEVGTTLTYLLLIASYRDDEVSEEHELARALEDLRGHEVPMELLPLRNLTQEDVRAYVAGALTSDAERVAELAALVYSRTSGNPFFVTSFLDALAEWGLVWWDPAQTHWRWHIDAIERAELPDDIIELFALTLRRLDGEDQRLLSLAACLGIRFQASTLSIISGRPFTACLAVLDRGVAAGLVVPLGDDVSLEGVPNRDRAYSFRHDRLQQAAYSLISHADLPATLLSIGRLLLDHLRPEEIEERLFEIVQKLNAGESRIEDVPELSRVIELNVRAARTAYAATAYASALQFYRAADRFLSRPGLAERLWRDAHGLLTQLFRGRADCEFLEGDFAEGEKCIQIAVAHARTAIEEAESLASLIVQYTLLARYPDAIATGRRALDALGVALPFEGYDQACRDELAEVRRLLAGRSARELADLPDMTDPTTLMAAKVLITLGPPCYRADQRLWSVIVPRVVAMTLLHGSIPQVGYSHTAFGGLLGWMDRDYATAKEFAELATILMTERYRDPSDQSVFHLMIGSSIRHWFSRLTDGSQDYRSAYESGQASNNLQYAAYAFGHDMYCRFYQGAPLEQVAREAEQSLAFSRARHNRWAVDLLEGGLSVFGALTGTAPPGDDANADLEAAYLKRLEEHENIQVLCIYKILVACARLVTGEVEGALAASDEAEPLLYTVGTQGLLPWPEHVFARSLILASLYPTADADRQTAWRADIAAMLRDLRIWADTSPENFEHKHRLVAAELARIEGRGDEAVPLYDQAVAGARAGALLHWEGLANERASAFWLERGADRLAQAYWQQAYVSYHRWGARTKVLAMEAELRAYLVRSLDGSAVADRRGEPEGSELIERQIRLLREDAGQAELAQRQRETATRAAELDQALHRLRVDSATRRRSEAPVRHMALHDALTKLANRRLLDEVLADTLSVGGRTVVHGALLFLDLDKFKPLNDSLGHDAGDRLLIEVARRLQECVREADTVARIGGDEFVVLIAGLGTDLALATDRATDMAEKMRAALAKPYRFSVRREGETESREHSCSASIGLLLFAVPTSSDPAAMLRQADAAMYRAKKAGGNRVHLVAAASDDAA